MNKHIAPEDFSASEALKLIAVPGPGNVATYAKLSDIELAAKALHHNILVYRSIPAHPAVSEYRERQMERVRSDIEDMLKALTNA